MRGSRPSRAARHKPAAARARRLMESAHAGAEQQAQSHKYIIAFAVVLAALLQVIDSSIVNVALPDMMGNLGASLDEIAWVSTGYILASVIVMPLTGWLGGMFGRKRYFVGLDHPVHDVELLLRRGALARPPHLLAAWCRASAAERS